MCTLAEEPDIFMTITAGVRLCFEYIFVYVCAKTSMIHTLKFDLNSLIPSLK